MPKKKDNVSAEKKPVCYKCQAWDIASASDIERTAEASSIIIGTCLRRNPQVIEHNGMLQAAWPVTEEDKGCYDIILKEEYK